MSSTDSNNNNRPAEPFAYYSSSSIHNLDLTALDSDISISEAKRQEAFDTSAKIKVLLIKAKRSLEQQQVNDTGSEAGADNGGGNDGGDCNLELEALIAKSLPSEKQSVRVANLSFQFQEYARLKSYQYFLSTGNLLPPSKLPPTISDEEYLAGSVMGLTEDLSRYVIGRATARDVSSVKIAKSLVEKCLKYLMKFDFRNGMLRRRYDGVKYQLKTCETVLYELSVTGLNVHGTNEIGTNSGKNENRDNDMDMDCEPQSKRVKTEPNGDASIADAIIPERELDELHARIEHRDDLREKLIKRCRDAQKAAKQAIFALHRPDYKRASRLIADCERIVKNDLNPIVEEDPSLHYGSYANVLEEYAEAKLFQVWLVGKDGDNGDENGNSKAKGKLLTPVEFSTIKLEPGEYLGGLCDLTGEVGRYAVQRGTQRDSDGVQFCLETNLSILFSLETLQRFPSGSFVHKKMDQLRRSVEKLERMLYELSLVEATGRHIVVDSVNEESIRGGRENNEKREAM
eukprot:CAMPEP_0203674278 /NCGR_PEP_ID=MMETSP0090-20130426/15585_1 /ASSEMBLY_ACC=CAM_ASM_001088 /TAXON_ID=426623 /ORGANISM="Chaetoceros affinis, Strain CCMP159" /LENGTH=514 /DNA_ID=CAMNT_0050540113 /DNA_START=115 /DNA_END=1659 /DNA_ORIENTATION=-